MSKKKDDTNTQTHSTFTVDGDVTTSMPSITKLLNRKRLEALEAGSKKVAPIEPPPVKDKGHTVQPSLRRRAQPKTKRPKRWDLMELRTSIDPVEKGLWILLQNGATSAVFLAIRAPLPGGNPTPHFLSTQAIGTSQHLRTWNGLKWDPIVVPETWNRFVKDGFVELSPNESHNAIRTAFGVQADEWITLFSIGPQKSCRGIIAVISRKSIASLHAEVRPLFSAPSSPAQAAA
jgi:hypothetical protein